MKNKHIRNQDYMNRFIYATVCMYVNLTSHNDKPIPNVLLIDSKIIIKNLIVY